MAPLTDYEKYIRTEELLGLQKKPEALTCHDEMQFQVVHQAHELYMKLIDHELRFVAELLGGTRWRARSRRSVAWRASSASCSRRSSCSTRSRRPTT